MTVAPPRQSDTAFAAECAAAAERLAGIARRTPLEPNSRLSAATGAHVWLKREDLQVGRSYKVRGAYNLISQLDAAERADARAHLGAALAALTATRRAVVLLHDVEGWTHREIGDHLGIAEGTVRAHLFWARRALRERLSAEWRRGAER